MALRTMVVMTAFASTRPRAFVDLAPALAAVVALAALAITVLLGGAVAWQGAWVVLGVGLTATAFGPLYGALAALLAVGLPWVLPASSGALAWGPPETTLAGLAALAWVAGGIGRANALRRAAMTAADGRRTRLLVEAALELGSAASEREILATLPPLVSRVLTAHHVSLLRVVDGGLELAAIVPPVLPAGTPIAERSIAGRAARTGLTQHVPDARRDPEYVSVEGLPADVAEVAVPLRVDGRAWAVLNVERPVATGFGDEDRATLEALARIAEAHLNRLATLQDVERQRREAGLLADIARRLAQADDPRRAAELALDAVLEAVAMDGGIVFVVYDGAFRPLAASEGLPQSIRRVLDEGIPWGRGRLHQVWRRGEPVFETDATTARLDPEFVALGLRALALVPVRDTDGDTVALIEIGSLGRAHRWSDDERRLLAAVASTLGAVLARATLRQRETELLAVVRQMARSDDAAELYQRVVEAAVRVVPGAEASSLLVRQPGGTFTFEGTVGFPLDLLREAGGLSDAQQLTWYGQGTQDWRSGRPRLRTGADVARASAIAAGEDARTILRSVGRSRQIRANLCVPVAFQEDVLAVLNVDAFTRDDAFGSRSVALAEALAQHVAVIVRQAQDRAALARSALTDPLTGLGNREAFNQTLARELQRAQRHGEPFAVAMLDLDRFKELNDALGHQAGDRALATVADALRSVVRASDAVFRWGGDEFAVVMPMLAPTAGQTAAARLVEAIAALDVQGHRLNASVGLANYPADGEDADTLLRRADDLMYAIKGSRPTTG